MHLIKSSRLFKSMIKNTLVNPFCKKLNHLSNHEKIGEEIPDLIDPDTYEKLKNQNPEFKKKIQRTILEITNLGIDTSDFPLISEENWLWIVKKSKPERLKFYKYLYNEMLTKNFKLFKKKEASMNYKSALTEINLPGHIEYCIGKNCPFLRINQSQLSNLLNLKLYAAQLFSNDIVIDMGYDQYMCDKQLKECAVQFRDSFSRNRKHENCYNIHLCNYPKDSKLNYFINSAMGDNIYNFPINIHEGSYLDIFDKDRLVYLSPYAKTVLRDVDPNAVYIIGGYVDFGNTMPVSQAKAKREGIKSAKFPVELYLDWVKGRKSFAYNVALSVMLDFQYYKNWSLAFRNLSRKVPGDDAKVFELRNISLDKENLMECRS